MSDEMIAQSNKRQGPHSPGPACRAAASAQASESKRAHLAAEGPPGLPSAQGCRVARRPRASLITVALHGGGEHSLEVTRSITHPDS